MKEYKNIVILTGAGISAESGIPTFRVDADGMWEQHNVEDVATPKGFKKNPELVQNFYNERRRQIQADDIFPNLAHLALARLEEEHDGNVTVVTQNVDNMHELAGTKNLIHMHGELLKARCQITRKVFDWHKDITPEDKCPCCDLMKTLRPHIVWFEEMPLEMDRIGNLIFEADLFISIGTSGNVYPAAGFVQEANDCHAHTIEVNLKPSLTESQFKEKRYGNATEILPKLVEQILNSKP